MRGMSVYPSIHPPTLVHLSDTLFILPKLCDQSLLRNQFSREAERLADEARWDALVAPLCDHKQLLSNALHGSEEGC